jgi:hypothetical protein
MQALEDRTEKSRREMDLHDTIDTVRVLNSRNQHVDIDKVRCICRVNCMLSDCVKAAAALLTSLVVARWH